MNGRNWTEKETKILKKNWATEEKEDLMRNLDKRSWSAIKSKANRLNLEDRPQALSFPEHLKLSKEERRRRANIVKDRFAKKCNLDEKQKEIIEGCLLGDGYLSLTKNQITPSSKLEITSEYKEFLLWLKNKLERLNFKGKISKAKKRYHRFRSPNYRDLVSLRKKWYPEEEKKFPSDINFSPLKLKIFYLGDGSLQKNRYPLLHICSRSMREAKNLINALKKENLNCYLINEETKYLAIRFPANSVVDFFNYIGKCPVDCFKYKWRDDIG